MPVPTTDDEDPGIPVAPDDTVVMPPLDAAV